VKLWKLLREALSPKETPIFLIAIIAFLMSTLVSIYIRSRLG
jgi:hypothetical protein